MGIKQFLKALVLTVGIVLGSPVSATVYLSEDWEGTPPTAWPYKNAPTASCPDNTFHSWEITFPNSECITSVGGVTDGWQLYGVDASLHKSGTQSYTEALVFPRRESATIEIPISPATTTNAKYYVGMWVYFKGDCAAANPGKGFCAATQANGEPNFHIFFINTAQGNTGARMNLLTRVPQAASNPQCESATTGGGPFLSWSFQMDGQDLTTGTWMHPTGANGCWNILAHLNEWHWYVFSFHPKNGSGGNADFELYVDDVLSYQALNYPYSSNDTRAYVERFLLALFNSDPATVPTGTTMQLNVDDITLRDTYPTMPGAGLLPSPNNLHRDP